MNYTFKKCNNDSKVKQKDYIKHKQFARGFISILLVLSLILSPALQINSFAAPKMLQKLNYNQSVVKVRNKRGVLSTAKVIHGKGGVQGATIFLQVGTQEPIEYKNKVRKNGYWTINLRQGLSQNHKAGEVLLDKPKLDIWIWQEKGDQKGIKSKVNVVLGTPEIVPSELSTNGGLIAGQKTIKVKVPHDAVAVWVGLPEAGKDRRIYRTSSNDTDWQLGDRADGFITQAKTVDWDPFFHTVEITTAKSIVKEDATKGFVATANQTKYSSISAFAPASNEAPTLTDLDGDTKTLINKEEISLDKIKALVKASDKEDDAGATVGGTLSHKITKIDNNSITDNDNLETIKEKLSVGDHSISFIATDSQGKNSTELTVQVTIYEKPVIKENPSPIEFIKGQDIDEAALKEKIKNNIDTKGSEITNIELLDPKPATDSIGSQNAKVKITLANGTSHEIEMPVTIKPESPSKKPDATPIEVEKGQDINTDEFKEKLKNSIDPKGGEVTVKNLPSTDELGEKEAVLEVAHTDGTKYEIKVPIDVKPQKPSIKETENQEAIEVEKGQDINSEEFKEKLKSKVDAKGGEVEVESLPDTNTVGKQNAVLKVTHPDGTTYKIEVPIDVKPQEPSIKETENQEAIEVEKGQDINSEEFKEKLKNKVDAKGGEVEVESLPDTNTVGKQSAVLKVTHPDGTTYKIEVPIDIKSEAPVKKDTKPFEITRGEPIDEEALKAMVDPKGGEVTVKNLDTITTDGKAILEIKSEDGTVHTIEVPIFIKDNEKQLASPSDADESLNSQVKKTLEIKQGDPIDEEALKAMVDPKGGTVEIVSLPDTTTKGIKKAILKITATDGTVSNVEITINISSNETYQGISHASSSSSSSGFRYNFSSSSSSSSLSNVGPGALLSNTTNDSSSDNSNNQIAIDNVSSDINKDNFLAVLKKKNRVPKTADTSNIPLLAFVSIISMLSLGIIVKKKKEDKKVKRNKIRR